MTLLLNNSKINFFVNFVFVVKVNFFSFSNCLTHFTNQLMFERTSLVF